MPTSISRFTVEFDTDSITILYDGVESLYWSSDEWLEDPDLVLTIGNAIYLSQKHPEELLKSGACHHEQVKKLQKNEEGK